MGLYVTVKVPVLSLQGTFEQRMGRILISIKKVIRVISTGVLSD